MSAPRWATVLLARLAGPDRADEVVGDLEEAHQRRVARRGRILAAVLTSLEALDVAVAVVRLRRRWRWRWRSATDDGPRGSPDGRRLGYKAGSRAGHSLRGLPVFSWVDVKLGIRLMVKHPGLSLVSIVGMAVAVAIGACAFGVIRGMTSSPLPLHEGDRVVTIQNVSEFGFDQERSTHLHDLATWREELDALEELGAYRIVTRNLVTADGVVAPARVVEMTASGFRIARVPPLVGRYLVDDDEVEGAAAVVVISHGVWQDRFGGDPYIVGRQLRVGATPHTIVGVMPPGFAFPINNRVWVPLRLRPTDFPNGKAPPIDVFGRLAPGASMEEVATRLATIGRRAAAAHPETHRGLRPRVFPYTQELVWGPWAWVLYLVQLFVSMILVVIAVNVAALVYARTITRTGEIAMRTALGASRGRIALQLFTEAFLLSSAAAVLGLVVARPVLQRIGLYIASSKGEQMPFWWDFDLSPAAVAYGLGLAVLAAVIVGVVPALGATGRHLRARLQSMGSGASGPRLGRTWTTLIVLQIAAAVAILPVGLSGVSKWIAVSRHTASSYPLDDVLTARLEIDPPATAPRPGAGAADPRERNVTDPWERYAILRDALLRRLQARPEILHVAVMGTAPWEDPDLPFEIEGGAAAPRSGISLAMESASTGHRLGRSRVSAGFFEALDLPILAGRALRDSDAGAEPTVVIVNQTFVELVLGGGNALGRRVRFLQAGAPTWESTPDAPWLTIVGVVPNFMASGLANPEAKAYLPMRADEPGAVSLAIRVRDGEAGRLASRLREIAVEIDPTIRLSGLESLKAKLLEGRAFAQLGIVAIAVLSLAVLLLAVAGLYALMSFTVVRRRREIGIRIALGAQPRRVLRGVLSRAAWQLALGISVGLTVAGALDRLLGGEVLGRQEALILPGVAALMAIVGFLAAWSPTRRGLRIHPSEALKAV